MSRIPTVSNAVWLSALVIVALVACGEMAMLPIAAGTGPLVMNRAGAGSPSANRITRVTAHAGSVQNKVTP